jgi:predicted lipoprotein with Yx(FWY)xxD motif
MIRVATVLFAFLFALAGCGRERYASTSMQSPSYASGGQAMAGSEMGGTMGNEVAQVAVRDKAPYGEFLTDQQGRTLYLFTPDEDAQASTCYDACAEAWPPLLTGMEPQAIHPDIQGGELGTVRRADGTLQVTYNGWPLYYYVQDAQPGQVTGQDVHDFGGEWYLLSPDGEKIEAHD